eukprot:IDg6337t1
MQEEIEQGVKHSTTNGSKADEDLEPAHKHRRVDEEPSMSAFAEDTGLVVGPVGLAVLPELGKRNRKGVAKEPRLEGPELRFILIELVDISNKDVAPLMLDDFKRPAHGIIVETRRVRECWQWVLSARKTAAHELYIFETFEVVSRCMSMLESEEGKAKLADIEWTKPSMHTQEEMVAWLNFFFRDLVAMKLMASESSSEDVRKRAQIAEECSDLMFYEERTIKHKCVAK